MKKQNLIRSTMIRTDRAFVKYRIIINPKKIGKPYIYKWKKYQDYNADVFEIRFSKNDNYFLRVDKKSGIPEYVKGRCFASQFSSKKQAKRYLYLYNRNKHSDVVYETDFYSIENCEDVSINEYCENLKCCGNCEKYYHICKDIKIKHPSEVCKKWVFDGLVSARRRNG